MEFKQGTSVFTADGTEVGHIDRVILDPQNGNVAGVVVRKGFLLAQDKVLPMALVADANDDHVTLRQGVDTDLKSLSDFQETHYVPIENGIPTSSQSANIPPSALYWYPPAGISTVYTGGVTSAVPNYSVETDTNIPEGTVALKEGTKVMSGENTYVGNVERIFIDAPSSKVTHFIISQGLFLKDRKMVPINWVKSIHENAVHLTVSADLLARLPAYSDTSKAGFTPGVV